MLESLEKNLDKCLKNPKMSRNLEKMVENLEKYHKIQKNARKF